MINLHASSERFQIWHGDCLAVLKTLPSNSADSIVTDPPSGIAFMGKEWDKDKGGRDAWIAWLAEIMAEAMRVLKPGGHALVWALPRTSHWTATAVENAGFEVRDIVHHLFGSGFPKNLDVSRSLDSLERDKWRKVVKGLDGIKTEEIVEAWIQHANNAGLQFQRSHEKAESSTQGGDSALGDVVLSINPGEPSLNAIVAELRSSGVSLMCGDLSTAQEHVSDTGSSALAMSAESLLESLEASIEAEVFTALGDAQASGDARAEAITKVAGALLIWLGRTKSSSKAATSALCAALTDALRLITLSRSETFQNSDTTSRTGFVSAMTVTITASMAERLISFMVATLRSEAEARALAATRGKKRIPYTGDALMRHDGENTRPWMEEALARGFAEVDDDDPKTDAARQWDGWGTALKPAAEHWILGRKPLAEKSVAANVLAHGVGALNIGGSRVGDEVLPAQVAGEAKVGTFERESMVTPERVGRWPAHLVLSHAPQCDDHACVWWCPVREIDGQGGTTRGKARDAATPVGGRGVVDFVQGIEVKHQFSYGDEGGPSRYFQTFDPTDETLFAYVPKPSAREKNEGLDDQPDRVLNRVNPGGLENDPRWAPVETKNSHPTTKSVKLMTYLINLITPPGGVVLDCFFGSGTTGVAALLGGFKIIGIEMDPTYIEIATGRVKHAASKAVVANG